MTISDIKTQEDVIKMIEESEPLRSGEGKYDRESDFCTMIEHMKERDVLITNETYVYFAKNFIKDNDGLKENIDRLLNAFYDLLSTSEFESMINELDDEYKVLINLNPSHIYKSEGWRSYIYWDNTLKSRFFVLLNKVWDYVMTGLGYILVVFLAYIFFFYYELITVELINTISTAMAIVAFFPLFITVTMVNASPNHDFLTKAFILLTFWYPVVYLVGLTGSIALLYSEYEYKIEVAKIVALACPVQLLLIWLIFWIWGWKEKRNHRDIDTNNKERAH